MELKESNVKSFNQLIKTPRKTVIARSEKQSEYIRALRERDIITVGKSKFNVASTNYNNNMILMEVAG